MIGVFDSGFGGLTVCREIIKNIPGEDIIFFADIGNFPYGTKSREDLENLSRNIIKFLIEKGADYIVVACNSASSIVTEDFRKDFSVPIFDVITSGVKGLEGRGYKKLGLIATEATIRAGILAAKIEDLGIDLVSKPAPELVELAQSRETGPEAEKVVEKSLEDFADHNIEALYLGCTHYTLIEDEINKYLNASLIDPAVMTSLDLKKMVKENWKDVTNFYYYSSDGHEANKEAVREILDNENVIVR